MKLFAIFIGGFFAVQGFGGEAAPARVPVLVELFTSEGCSSCPPADRLLAKLDREQPVEGAEIIVLSEHVDYWNQLGWKDPFSSAQYTARQRDYAAALEGDVYTPEMVVDGVKGFVGSDEADARRAIREAAKAQKIPIRIESKRDGDKTSISIKIQSIPEGTLYLALAHDSAKSQVLRGENGGRALSHVAVVYSLQKLAKPDRTAAGYEREVLVKCEPGARVVAFVAKGGVGKVVAAGQGRL